MDDDLRQLLFLVWQDVVQLLRWSAAGGGSPPRARGPTAPADDADLPGTARVETSTTRLVALVRTPEPVPLRRLAGAVDALGAAAISALAEASSWTVPATP